MRDLVRYVAELDIDRERFVEDLRTHAGAARATEDVEFADPFCVYRHPLGLRGLQTASVGHCMDA